MKKTSISNILQSFDPHHSTFKEPKRDIINHSLNILYVEDNILNQELGKQVFKILGHHLQIASNGEEALLILVKQKFDLIFMDINMPVMNGYEATRIIRENLCLKVPIIALTSRDSNADIENCKLNGMNDHLKKPLDIEELKHIVNHPKNFNRFAATAKN
jgi:CheY-like chemotaxis protein